jgi:hypothetical protein
MTAGSPAAFGLARVCGLWRAVTVVTRANWQTMKEAYAVRGTGPLTRLATVRPSMMIGG